MVGCCGCDRVRLLSFHHPLLEDESETDRAGPVERLHAAIVENVNMYVHVRAVGAQSAATLWLGVSAL